LKLLYWSAEVNSPSKTRTIDMQKETSHIHKDLSRGKKLLKNPYYMYCINQRIEKKYNACSSLSTLCKCINYLSTWLTDLGLTLSQFQAFPSSYFLRKLPLLFRNFTPRTCAITIGQSSDCMHHMYNLE